MKTNDLNQRFNSFFSYNFDQKIIDYWNFAPGVDMDSSFGLRPKPFILGSFLSRKYQFQKIYHVAQ
jgi:hypothetical protein